MTQSSWPRFALEELSDSIEYGLTASAKQIPDGPRFLRITDIQNGCVDWRTVPSCDASEADVAKYNLRVGDIVFARTGATTGKSFLIRECPERATFASYLIRVRPGERADPRYLAHFFGTPDYWQQIQREAQGAGQPGVNGTKLKNLSVPLPPLAEQRRIADILDKADAIRRKRREAFCVSEKLPGSLLLSLFGDPISNPMGWQKRRIGEVTNRITKGESPNWQGFTYQSSGVVFITSENVLWGTLDASEPKYIPSEFHEKLQRSQLRPGDVLVNLVGASIGRACQVPQAILPANVNQAVGVVTVNEKEILPEFLLQQLLTPQMQQQLQGDIVEVARANISLTNVRDLPVIVPPLETQANWKQQLDKHSAISTSLSLACRQADGLFHSLVQRAFRGEL